MLLYQTVKFNRGFYLTVEIFFFQLFFFYYYFLIQIPGKIIIYIQLAWCGFLFVSFKTMPIGIIHTLFRCVKELHLLNATGLFPSHFFFSKALETKHDPVGSRFSHILPDDVLEKISWAVFVCCSLP